MFQIKIENSDVVLLDFYVSEKDWEDAEDHYGSNAFIGHTFDERMEMTAIWKVSVGEHAEYTQSLDAKGLEWGLYKKDKKVM